MYGDGRDLVAAVPVDEDHLRVSCLEPFDFVSLSLTTAALVLHNSQRWRGRFGNAPFGAL